MKLLCLAQPVNERSNTHHEERCLKRSDPPLHLNNKCLICLVLLQGQWIGSNRWYSEVNKSELRVVCSKKSSYIIEETFFSKLTILVGKINKLQDDICFQQLVYFNLCLVPSGCGCSLLFTMTDPLCSLTTFLSLLSHPISIRHWFAEIRLISGPIPSPVTLSHDMPCEG